MIFKILTSQQWDSFQADGVFEGAPIDLSDGYIHFSASEQVQETADKHFAGQQGLIVAEVDEDRLWRQPQMGSVSRRPAFSASLRVAQAV